jgi:glycosyltransferase involved in cell wall biosynthesis
VKITVISRWYNEATLAPLFLSHYAFADEIIILLDETTNDGTAEIIAGYANASIRGYRLPDKINYGITTALVTRAAATVDGDWIMAPDTDEFIFPAENDDARTVLSQANGNLIYADMWGVYRHGTDRDLDSSWPVVRQRRHGDPNKTIGWNSLYRKPIIVKAGLGIDWWPGFHRYRANPKIRVSSTRFIGAHWIMADPDLAVARRMRGRRELQSGENLHYNWGFHNFDITEAKVRAECKAHENDPALF